MKTTLTIIDAIRAKLEARTDRSAWGRGLRSEQRGYYTGTLIYTREGVSA